MSVRDAVLGRLSQPHRQALAPFLREEGEALAFDLRADVTGTSRAIGAAHRLEDRAFAALRALDDALDDARVGRVDLWNAELGNDRLAELLKQPWTAHVTSLNLGGNRLTKKGLQALSRSALAEGLTELVLSYNRLGAGCDALKLPRLEALDLVYAGVDGKGLAALAKAKLPALRALSLERAAASTTVEKLLRAQRMADAIPAGGYTAGELGAFCGSELARGLESLILDGLVLERDALAALAAAELPNLRRLSLREVALGPAGVSALASGRGLSGLRALELAGTFGPLHENAFEGGGMVIRAASPPAGASEALAALGQASFAPGLERLVIESTPLPPEGLAALLPPLAALRRLELTNVMANGQPGRGDPLARAVAAHARVGEVLFLKSAGVGQDGLLALLDAPWVRELKTLSLSGNGLGDRAAEPLAAAPLRITTLGLGHSNLTDRGLTALSRARWFGGVERIDLSWNRLSDPSVATLLDAAGEGLRLLDLEHNAFSPEGCERLAPLRGVRTADQDPTRVPPSIHGAFGLRLEPADGADYVDKPPPVLAPERAAFPYPGGAARGWSHPDWALAWTVADGQCLTALLHVPDVRAVAVTPPLRFARASFDLDPAGRWCALAAYEDGVYAISTESGEARRVGPVFRHLGGVAFVAGGRFCVLHADSAGDWEGCLDVYREQAGEWVQEQRLRGFYGVRDALLPADDGRLLVVYGKSSGGLTFVGFRDEGLRVLGHLPLRSFTVIRPGGRAVISATAFKYEVAGLDEALERAFAEGEPPTTLPFTAPE